MQTISLVFYWIAYILVGVSIQKIFPGVDALLPGFLIALQSNNKPVVFWLFVVFTLIQEGAGNLHFGASILWYGGHIVLYKVCERLVVPTGLAGALLFAVMSGVYGLFVIGFMVGIENISIEYVTALRECLIQTLFIPILWLFFSGLRHRMVKQYVAVD